MKTTTSILFFRPTQECLETLTTSTPSYEKKLNHWVALGLSMKMEQFLQWTILRPGVRNMKAKCLVQIHLKNLGVGTQILLPHGDLQVGELMDQRGTASSSAEVPRCWPSGKKPPRTEGKDETMEAASTYG